MFLFFGLNFVGAIMRNLEFIIFWINLTWEPCFISSVPWCDSYKLWIVLKGCLVEVSFLIEFRSTEVSFLIEFRSMEVGVSGESRPEEVSGQAEGFCWSPYGRKNGRLRNRNHILTKNLGRWSHVAVRVFLWWYFGVPGVLLLTRLYLG